MKTLNFFTSYKQTNKQNNKRNKKKNLLFQISKTKSIKKFSPKEVQIVKAIIKFKNC